MIRFGIAGYGHIGMRHAHLIAQHAEARLAGGFDPRPDRMQVAALAYPSSTPYASYHDMLQDPQVDIVVVCTPNGLHAMQAIEALQAGKHVLVEKPMALFAAEATEMIRASAESGKSLFVVKQNRFNPPVQAVKALLDQGKLGRVYTVSVHGYWNRGNAYYAQSDWKGTLALDGGTLYTQYSHFIDIVYYLFGDMEIAHATFDNVCHTGSIEFEDTGVVVFRLVAHDALGTLHYTTSAFQQNMEGSITLFTEKATIKIGGKYLNTIDYQCTDGFDIADLPESGPANNYGHYEGSMSNHDKVIHNVIQSLQGKEQIMTNAYDGLKVVEIIEHIYATGNRQ